MVLAVIFSPKLARKIHAETEVRVRTQKMDTNVLVYMVTLVKIANNKKASALQIHVRMMVLVYKLEIVTNVNALLDFLGQNVRSTSTTAKAILVQMEEHV